MRLDGLRDKQLPYVNELRSTFKQHQCHVINAPPGAGKTAIAAYLAQSFANAGMKTVFAAPYVTLVDQTWVRFQEYGMDEPSVIWQKDPRFDERKLIHIASADTLICKNEVLPENTRVLIWDECHIKRADLLQHIHDNPDLKVIGLSATPYQDWMGQTYTNLIKPFTTRDFINDSLLTPFEIYMPNLGENRERMASIKVRQGDYAVGPAAAAMMDIKLVGDIVGNWLKNAVDDRGNHLQTIGFAMNKSAANAYAAEFIKLGIPAEVIVDKTPKHERTQIFKRFNQGITKIIWNVGVLGAGFDADVRCIIWARPSKSEIVWVQGALRGSRPADGKSCCKLFDHTPTYFELGDPCDIEYYELSDGSDGLEKKRAERREKEVLESRSKICGKCGRKKEPKEYKCKSCGHKPIAGEAPDIDESIGLVKASGDAEKYTKADKQRYWSELQGWAVSERNRTGKPVNPGRLANLYRDKFKIWPRSLSDTPLEPGPELLKMIKYNRIKYAKQMAKKNA